MNSSDSKSGHTAGAGLSATQRLVLAEIANGMHSGWVGHGRSRSILLERGLIVEHCDPLPRYEATDAGRAAIAAATGGTKA